ncbi:hypothetical protein IVB18_21200 [Bradyrhizobium sp. 186]|uniref:hypothetical protein n=1 Tax=Bradyrhizobium sp. 186 TaxID=2782654 RepID=UPI002000C2FF|nr:hypothetical protein [Bradyrhizobium sp. 186]UPK39515.1 hypothetical protein IVB18_21200 [Bradyrhizobium sp. 186]
MKFEMFDVVNYDVWGDLVKKWAHDKSSRPTTVTEFKDQLDKAGVVAKYPRPFTELVFIETSYTDGKLLIKLPPAELIDEAEKDLLGSNYPLPPFYTDDMRDSNLENDTPDGRLVFHSKRVGEYTIKFCG